MHRNIFGQKLLCKEFGRFQRYIYLRKCNFLHHQAFPVLPDSLYTSDINLTGAKEKSEKLLHYHEKLKRICFEGGGEKGQMLHVQKNKKILPRDRIKYLFDEGSDTLELCLQAGLGLEYGDIPGASSVSVIGQIHGHYCLVAANDGTLKGGTFFPITVKKNLRAQEVGNINTLPSIYLVDSGGGFLPLQSDIFPDKLHGGRGFYNQAVDGSQGIPQLALVCGSCTAGGAYVPMMCDDAAIVHRIGTIFLGGPPLVKAATGEDVSSEQLGGATMHCSVSGCTDYFAATEQEGYEMLRDAVATLDIGRESSREQPLSPRYSSAELDIVCGLEAIGRQQLLGVVSRVVDDSRFREFKQNYGANLLTGYATIDQRRVGIVANCGPLSYEDGMKGTHFVQVCEQRNIPLLFLQNSGTIESYWNAEAALCREESVYVLKGRGAMIAAVSVAKVPKVALNIGGCHGDDNYTMCGPSFNPNFSFCWPGAETSLSPPPTPAAVKDVSGKEASNSKASKKTMSAFTFPPHSSWFTASRVLNDGIISPSETRNVVSHCLRIFAQMERINRKKILSPIYRF